MCTGIYVKFIFFRSFRSRCNRHLDVFLIVIGIIRLHFCDSNSYLHRLFLALIWVVKFYILFRFLWWERSSEVNRLVDDVFYWIYIFRYCNFCNSLTMKEEIIFVHCFGVISQNFYRHLSKVWKGRLTFANVISFCLKTIEEKSFEFEFVVLGSTSEIIRILHAHSHKWVKCIVSSVVN